MTLSPLSLLALALATTPAFAQSGFTDAGTPLTHAPAGISGPSFGTGCGTGSTVAAPFVGGNGFAGNMFDIAPTVDMTIECIDVNWSEIESIDVAIWYCPGTVVGNDVNQLGNWQLFGTGTAMGAGLNLPTNVVLNTGGGVFYAGFTYGIYVQVVNYATTVGYLGYTDDVGPNIYNGTHCNLTTYYGKGDGLTAGTFIYRAWNGVLYTDRAGPVLGKSGTCPGPMNISFANCTPGGPVAILYGAAGSYTKPNNPCQGLVVGIASPSLGALMNAGGNGAGAINLNVPGAACGLTVQAVDVRTCRTTNTITL
jgi:hypothetical protein